MREERKVSQHAIYTLEKSAPSAGAT